MTSSAASLAALAQCAHRIRRYALRMGEVQGQGYIGQALGWPMCWPWPTAMR